MVHPTRRDRRLDARVRGGFRLELDSAQTGKLLQVCDLSASGVSFRITTRLPYMERVSCLLWLQDDDRPGQLGEHSCTGVVVRCDALEHADTGAEAGYEVALFFIDTPPGTLAAIAAHVAGAPGPDDPAA